MGEYYYESPYIGKVYLKGNNFSTLKEYFVLTSTYIVGNYEVGTCVYKPEMVAKSSRNSQDLVYVYVAVLGENDKFTQYVWRCKFTTRQPREITGRFARLRKFFSRNFGSNELPLETALQYAKMQANCLAGITQNQMLRINEIVAQMKLEETARDQVLKELSSSDRSDQNSQAD